MCPWKNESTRAPSCTIYIINPSPVPQTMSSSGTEQTMSSQEHPDFYILEKMADIQIKSTANLIISFKSHVAFYHIVSNEVLP